MAYEGNSLDFVSNALIAPVVTVDGSHVIHIGMTWLAGVYYPARASDPTGLTTANKGYLYFNTTHGKLRVWTGAGWEQVTSVSSPVVAAPTITSFTPSHALTGASIVITGTAFTDATAVAIGGVAVASFVINSDTQITAVVAAGNPNGTVSVTNPLGTATSSGTFTHDFPPAITSFTPTHGLTGASVVITGTAFTGATAVTIGGVNVASFVVNSSTQITAVVAAGNVTGTVAVTTPFGTGTSAGTFTHDFPPAITSFTPSSGGVASSVVITGTNFTGATAVAFNGTNAPSYVVNSSTQITVTVPTGATTGTITVTTPFGTATSSGTFTVAAAYATEVLADSPGAFLRTTETSGTTLADAAGNGNFVDNGGFTGTCTFNITTPTGKGIRWDTVGGGRGFERFSAGAIRSLDVFTWEWIGKVPDHTDNYYVVGCTDGGLLAAGGYAIGWRLGRLAVSDNGGWHFLSSATTLDDGNFHHLAITWDGTTFRGYVNGVLQSSNTYAPGGALPALNGSHNVVFGRTAAGTTWGLGAGAIVGDLAFYHATLTGTRILAHATAGGF